MIINCVDCFDEISTEDAFLIPSLRGHYSYCLWLSPNLRCIACSFLCFLVIASSIKANSLSGLAAAYNEFKLMVKKQRLLQPEQFHWR